MDGLLNFLTHGAPLVRFARQSSAINRIVQTKEPPRVVLLDPTFLILFIHDLAIRDYDLTSIVKYTDDTTLQVKVCTIEIDLSREVVNQFFSLTQNNAIACNLKKM